MKFLADEELFSEKIKEYFLMGISDTKMTKLLRDDFGRSDGISTKSIQRKRKKLGLKSSAQLQATIEMLEPYISEIRERFPGMGRRAMRTTLLHDYHLKVSEETIGSFLSTPFQPKQAPTTWNSQYYKLQASYVWCKRLPCYRLRCFFQ